MALENCKNGLFQSRAVIPELSEDVFFLGSHEAEGFGAEARLTH